jgi:hypothetical protein
VVLFLVYHPGNCLPRKLTVLRLDKEQFRLVDELRKGLMEKSSKGSLKSESESSSSAANPRATTIQFV